MRKDLLTLLGCSGSIAISLMSVSSASANNLSVREYVFTSPNEGTLLAVESPSEDLANCACQNPDLVDAEGDLAISLYGCDCSAHRLRVQNLTNQNF